MEEILASIRRIIADDGVTTQPPRVEPARVEPLSRVEPARMEPVARVEAAPSEPTRREPLFREAAVRESAFRETTAREPSSSLAPDEPANAELAIAPRASHVDPFEASALDPLDALTSRLGGPRLGLSVRTPVAPEPAEQFDVAQAVAAAASAGFGLTPAAIEAPAVVEAAPSRPAPMLSRETDAAVAAQFGKLSEALLANNAQRLDEMTRQMLRPMLKSWLDDNLPVLVERLVRAEIERVARGGR